MRTCKVCGEEKPLAEYYTYWDKRNQKHYNYHKCKVCHNADITARVKADPAKVRLRHLKYKLRTEYHITLEDYEALLVEQNGLCAICNGEPHGEFLSVDHNHETGKVRGLLCRNCNVGLGALKDSPDVLRRAADYLENRTFYGKRVDGTGSFRGSDISTKAA